MKKNILEKKEYVKAEIEFVKFDYAAVCSDSDVEIKEIETDESEEEIEFDEVVGDSELEIDFFDEEPAGE